MSEQNGSEEQKHEIGLIACIAFCVGPMIGGGVFTMSGIAVDTAGPAALLAYVLAGAIMLLSALSFIVVASRSRTGDSGYAPIGDILSPGWRFIVMWGFYLNAVIVTAFVLLSFGIYLHTYFVEVLGQVPAALLAMAAIALLNLGPADLVGKAETWLVGFKIGILLLFIGYGLASIGAAKFLPFAPHGARSVMHATALLFVAYTGFNAVTNMAGSVKDANRTVPKAIIISIAISAAVYCGVVLAMLASGLTSFGQAGVGKAATELMGSWGGPLIALAACISTLSAANANILGASELMIRLARQGDVPAVAGRVSRSGRPYISVVFASAVAALCIAFAGGAETVVGLSNVTAILAMMVVNVAAFRLAIQGWPGDGVKLPGKWVIPVLGFLTSASQLPSLGLKAVIAGVLMTVMGYVLFAMRHKTWLAGDMEALERRIRRLETPLGRSMRTLKRAI